MTPEDELRIKIIRQKASIGAGASIDHLFQNSYNRAENKFDNDIVRRTIEDARRLKKRFKI